MSRASDRLALGLAASAAVIAVLGATPLGQAAQRAVLPAQSVGPAQLKASAVTSVKIKNASLTKADFRAGALIGPSGPRGASGPAGAAGAPGPTGGVGPHGVREPEKVVVSSPTQSGNGVVTVDATCPTGKKVVYGFAASSSGALATVILDSYPTSDTTWRVKARFVGGGTTSWTAGVSLLCARFGA